MKKLKKSLSVLLTTVMVFCMLTAGGLSAFAETTGTYGNLRYIIHDGEVKIEGYVNNIVGELVIPDTIDGYPVTAIGFDAFDSCAEMTNVVIPESVTEIEYCAFWGCISLKKVVLPSRLTEISMALFALCSSLEEVDIPDGVTRIGDEAFDNCSNLKSIVIPNGVTYIGGYAFSSCKSLTEIIIPENVTEIGDGAFRDCTALTEIVVPKSVTIIGKYVFRDCTNLEKITLSGNLSNIGSAAFFNCINLKEIVIPDGVKTIEAETFAGCTSLESVDLPDGLTSIGMDAFADCTSLTSIDIPESVEQIRFGAFRNTGLDKIVINNRNCTLDYDEELLPEDTVIYGYLNSPAHMYAQIYNRTFIALEDDACPHTFSDWTVAEDADCTQRGFAYRVCTRCCEVETKILPPVGHSDANGDALCDVCGAAMDEEIVTVPEKEATDEQTGVSVIYPDGTFDGAAEIQVTPVAQGEAYQLISHKEGNYKVTMFDISVTVDGEQVQPNGMVTVRIPLPKGYNPNKCVVYYVAADGTMEELKTYHVKDGYVWFETDHFSYYAVVEEETESADRPSWMDTSLNFMQTLIDFFYRLAEWFKSLFGAA